MSDDPSALPLVELTPCSQSLASCFSDWVCAALHIAQDPHREAPRVMFGMLIGVLACCPFDPRVLGFVPSMWCREDILALRVLRAQAVLHRNFPALSSDCVVQARGIFRILLTGWRYAV
jgi:hypothetical protein